MPTLARLLALGIAVLPSLAGADARPSPALAKEMERAVATVNQSLGLESYPDPHCLEREFGKLIKPGEVQSCLAKAMKDGFPEAGKGYVIVVLMAEVGPSTVFALALEAPGWAILSCDPGKPCPLRKSGSDKFGKRVADRIERACKGEHTVWWPGRKGCP